MSRYIIVINITDETYTAIQEWQELKVFNSEADCVSFMDAHILGKLPWQIVELEI